MSEIKETFPVSQKIRKKTYIYVYPEFVVGYTIAINLLYGVF